MSLTRNLAIATGGLTALFVAIGADPADRLPLAQAVLYWATHIGLGLGTAVLATHVLCAWPTGRRWPIWWVIVLGGTLGAAAFTPFALGVEALMPAAQANDLDDDWIDALEARGGLYAALGEFLQLFPSYIAAWILVQSTPLIDAYRQRPDSDRHADTHGQPTTPSADLAHEQPAIDRSLPAPKTERLLTQLPRRLGEAIWIRADLHYLHITATHGETTLLGTLAAVEAEEGERGLRVHRSFWVSLPHVRRLIKDAYGWRCELSDGNSVPVSRRRVSAVRQRLDAAP